MKFCVNCKHCIPAPSGHMSSSRCDKITTGPDQDWYVTGDEQYAKRNVFCSIARYDYDDRCGTDAKWFEPIEITKVAA